MKICFEGIDGCGKSTQVKMLKEALEEMGLKPCLVKHPGQTEFGQALRELILYGPQPGSDLAHRLLFWADMVETTARYQNKQVIIFDRHPKYSNFAYSKGMGFDKETYFSVLSAILDHVLKPDIAFIIDVPVEVAFVRIHQRGKKLTAVEKRGKTYFECVRAAYQNLERIYPEVIVVDGTRNPQEVHQEILYEVKKKFDL
jgi:dTMP kinase